MREFNIYKSNSSKRLQVWADFLGMYIAIDEDDSCWAHTKEPKLLLKPSEEYGTDCGAWVSDGAIIYIPYEIVGFFGDWKKSLTKPKETT